MDREALFASAGTFRGAYEAVDWAATPLGPPEGWGPELDAAVDLVLHTRFPSTLLWGATLTLVYNAAYAATIAGKHPEALGAPAEAVFPEAWHIIGPMLTDVLAGRGTTYVEDRLVPLHRHGFLEECYFTFSYSPVRDAGGRIRGVLDIAAETTAQVVDRRRLALLSRLRERLLDAAGSDDVCDRTVQALRESPEDFRAAEVRLPGRRTGGDPRLPAEPGAPPRGDAPVLERTEHGTVAWVPLAGGAVLVALLSARLPVDAAFGEFLSLVGAAISLGLDSVRMREAERGLSEALQRSMLTQPPEVPGVAMAVRYRPAAELAQVGGDWYDAFLLGDGALALVIGDAAGHDRQAAAAMGEVRSLLRGLAFTLQEPPARVLEALDGALQGLVPGLSVTGILARLEVDRRTLRWSSAGHLPPVVLEPDGTTRILRTVPDLLLGIRRGARTDHTTVLRPGATVVLFTDGLVERRGIPLDRSLAWLAETLEGHHDLGPEALCDHVVGQLGYGVEDDVALLVVRVTG